MTKKSSPPSEQNINTILPRQKSRLPRALRRIWSVDDFQIAAKRHLPLPVYAYYASAVEDRATHEANRTAFNAYEFIPRILIDTNTRHQRVTLFGKTYDAPFGIAPMGLSGLACFEGDITIAKTAAAQNIPSVLSGMSLVPLERVADEGKGRWFQMYQPGETNRIEALLDRVAKAGFDTLVLTVDVAVSANPENQLRHGFSAPLRPSFSLGWQGLTHPNWSLKTGLRTLVANGIPRFENVDAIAGPPIVSRSLSRDLGQRDRLNWHHVDIIRKRWKGTLILKGLLAPQDCTLAIEHGVDGIIVSNHGGRQLDGTQASLKALPAMVDAANSMPVMIDSGFRRGSDILKAYALGAAFVFIGRPFLFAAAVGGAAGITHCTTLLKAEIDRNMGMLGITQINHQTLKNLTVPA